MDRTAALEELVRGLAETVTRIEAVEQGLSPEQLATSPTPDGWSPNQILWHIRATADVHEEHARRILNEDQPHWRHVSPRARMKKSRYDQLAFADSSTAFRQQRTALIELLAGISPDGWQRIALVTVAHKPGQDWRLPLRALVWGMADHEDGHCHQMEQVADALRAGQG